MRNAGGQASASTSTWSNLPSNILMLFVQNLSYVDQIYFQAVCKNWRYNIDRVVKHTDKLPWILAINPSRKYNTDVSKSSSSSCYLYNPTYKQKYSIESEVLVGATVQASKYGWLLLSKETEFSFLFYFYCPFTNAIVELPALKTKKRSQCYNAKATFSTVPTSANCVVCVALTKDYSRPPPPSGKYKVFVDTCSPGDNSWKMSCFYSSYEMAICQAAYMDGVFYFGIHKNYFEMMIGAYKHEKKEWRTYGNMFFFNQSFLIESRDDGNLLMTYSTVRKENDVQWHVFKFEPSQMNWPEVKSLGDRMLFLGLTSTSVPGSKLGNTIHEAGYDYCSSNIFKVSESHLCPQIYDWIEDKGLSRIWIQPPEIVSTMQNGARQTPTWSNLPSDILIFIMESLSYVDQIYFRAVCKNWRFDIHGVVKYSDKMSWIFRVGLRSDKKYDSFGYLFDPTYKRKYIIESEILDGAKAYVSKYGWLLLAKETEFKLLFYFYCPFTNQIIQLPEFKMKMKKKYCCYAIQATFSAAPTSSDCVICLALTRGRYGHGRIRRDKHKFILSTCSPGDDSWNMASFYISNELQFYGATCVRGVFYFIYADQDELEHIEIGVYKPGMQEWKTYEGPYFSDRLSFYGSYYLIDESCDDGELLIVYNEISARDDVWQWHVFRFDLSEINWRKVESLGDRMLFLGLTSTSMRGGKLANTIHEAVGNCLGGYYCSSKFYEASKSQLCPRIYDWIEEKGLPIIWVQPPEIGMRNRFNNSSSCLF